MKGKAKLTEEILNEGASRRGGWSREQLRLFGEWTGRNLRKGWKHRIIGTYWDSDILELFIRLKDYHLDKVETDEMERQVDRLEREWR